MNRTKLLTFAAYNTFFWVAFWLFCYWTFPYERVAGFLSDKVAESGVGYTLEIGDLSPYWLTGVELANVKVLKQGKTEPSPEAKPAGDDGAIHVREARARLGILGLLFGGTSVNFDALLEQGEIEGSYEEDGDQKHVDARLDKIDLGKLGLLDSLISLPAQGSLEGECDLTLGKEPSQSTGRVKLVLKGLTLGDGKAKLKVGAMGGLTIDPIEAGNVTLELDVKQGVGEVKKLTTDGKDVELEGSGQVRFSEPLSRSRLDVLLRIKFTDAYKNKSSRTKALFSLLDGSSVSQVKAAKTPDGALAFRLTGPMATVRAVPAGKTRDVGAGARTPAMRRASQAVETPAPSPGDDDETE